MGRLHSLGVVQPEVVPRLGSGQQGQSKQSVARDVPTSPKRSQQEPLLKVPWHMVNVQAEQGKRYFEGGLKMTCPN